MRITFEAFRNFLEGAGSILDISSRNPIPPNDFVGFESGHNTFTALKKDCHNICQDMSEAWFTVLESPPNFLPYDKRK